ncbi:MAG TPA: SDR family oxidoreductase [Gemmatimonadales bacterium]|nr:SDR family oxidoreductase [Gemmatimonadales bacterium]
MTGGGGLAGRGAVVTGAGRGIGMAVARALVEAGAAVVVAARTRKAIEAVATKLNAAGGRAWAVSCDVTDPANVAALALAAESHLGHVDILVNNAGVSHSAPLRKTTLEDWNRILAVNATGTFLCTQAFLPGMLERRWGRVVNIASVAGLEGGKYIAAYSTSKHAVVGFTRSVGAEVAGTGVTVNAVCPGYVDTDMTQESVARIAAKTKMSPEAALRAALETTGQRRLISPEDVAQAVLKLCEDAGRETNGETVVIAEGGAHR